ncbi:MAG: PAS domain S-box protein, partial [Candidatus Aminicenantes bacterium]
MKEEPDIIKELREAEKIGLLQSMFQNTFEELEAPDESIEKTSDQTSHMIRDLEKRTNEHELGCVEEKYRTIFENYAIAITLADNKERIVSWNKYSEELFNMTQNELYLKSVSSLYPPKEWQKIRAENIRQKGIKYRMETRMIKKNQGCFDAELSLCVLRGKEGKTVGSVGIIKDITKLKETERELKTSEERYRTIFENSAVAITLTDENEQIISWNKYAERLLDMSKEDFHMKPVESLYPPEEWQKIRAENIRKKGLQHHLETKMVKKNNELINVNLSLSVLKDHEGNVIGSIGVIEDITERKKAEKELRRSREEYITVTNLTGDIIMKVDKEGRWTFLNDEACKFWGKPRNKLLGAKFVDYLHPKDAEKTTAAIQEMIKIKQMVKDLVNRQKTPNGWRIVEWNGIPIFNEAGNYTGFQATGRDITGKKSAEKELKESQKHFQTLFNTMIDPVVIVDPKGTFLEITDKVEEITGFKREELLGKNFLRTKIATGKSKRILLKSLIKRMAGIKLAPYEVGVLTKDGQKIPFEVNAAKIDYFGKPADMVVFRDITKRKLAEEKLQKSESKFRNLAEQSPNMIFIKKRGRVVYANKRCEEIMGYKREEFYSPDFDFLTLIAPESIELIKTSFRKHMNGEEIAPYEYKLITKDGKKIDAIITTKLIKHEEDFAILGIITDISEQKKNEEELRKAHRKVAKLNQELEQRVEARTAEVQKLLRQKNEFIQQLGHDLKIPLSPLLGLLPLLEKTEKDPKSKELIEVLHRNIDRMRNIVLKTLEFAELNTSSVVFYIEDINLWEVVENSIKDQQLMYDEKGITLENKIDENIFVKADKLRLNEVFNNFINNAIKYSPLDGSITVDAHDDGDFVTVSVMDSGIGMTTDQIDRIFDEFYKADESRHDFGSSGLGLPICKRIVEKHGGRIWAESPGLKKGSTFYFTIPSGS